MNIVFFTLYFTNNKLCNRLINKPTLIVHMFVKKNHLEFFSLSQNQSCLEKEKKNDMLTMHE